MPRFHPDTVWTAALPGAPELPAFGRLCSRLAKALGHDELRFASKAQRSWIEAARRVFPAMAAAGAPDIGHRYLAHDERPFFKQLDWALGHEMERAARDSGSESPASMSVFSFEFRGEPRSKLRVASSLEQGGARASMRSMDEAFGSGSASRCFALGHEFGHAWLNILGHRAAGAWASASDPGPFATRCAELSKSEELALVDFDSQEREPGAAPGAPLDEAMCMDCFEEAACDAVGCWALAKLGVADPMEKAMAYRGRAVAGGMDPSRNTAWLLRALGPQSLKLGFRGFSESIQAKTAALAPQVFKAFELGAAEARRDDLDRSMASRRKP